MTERTGGGKNFSIRREQGIDPMGEPVDFYTLPKGTLLTGVTLGINGSFMPISEAKLPRTLEARVVEPALPNFLSTRRILAPDSAERRGYASTLAVYTRTLNKMTELGIEVSESEEEIQKKIQDYGAVLAKIDQTLRIGSTLGMFPHLKPILDEVTEIQFIV